MGQMTTAPTIYCHPLSRWERVGAKAYRNRCIGQLLVILFIALAFKYFYSNANVNQLRWILAPVTQAVELISGRDFEFEPYAGYIDSNHTFVIAASCAGVNFLITAFLMLSLGNLWHKRSQGARWSFLPVAAGLAYLATLVANTVRITTAMQLRRVNVGWLDANQLHRLEGILVYFGFLLLLYVLIERRSHRQTAGSFSHRDTWQMILRRSFFPLLIYYATTLGLPVLNGAFHQAGFWQHSLFVLLIPLVFIIPFAGFLLMRKRSRAIGPS